MTQTMAKRQAPEPNKKQEQRRKDEARIADKVLVQLGRPPGVMKTTATKVGDYNYRVNVWIADPGGEQMCIKSGKIKHSFFITDTADGLASTPPIETLY